MAKPEEKRRAKLLRVNGNSIKDIAKELQVSPSSVSLWCRDVVLSKQQIADLERRAKDPHYGRRLEYSQAQRRSRVEKEEKLMLKGTQDVGQLSRRELFLVGVALYWSDGFKKDSQVGFANSDPQMIKLFVKWLIECCGRSVEELLFRVTVNSAHQYRVEEVQQYWADVLAVSMDSFQKPFFQNVRWKKQYDDPRSYFGVLRVRVRRSVNFLRLIRGWIEGLKVNTEKKRGGTVVDLLQFAGEWKGTELASDELWHDLLGERYPIAGRGKG
jgi:hypothetical protein